MARAAETQVNGLSASSTYSTCGSASSPGPGSRSLLPGYSQAGYWRRNEIVCKSQRGASARRNSVLYCAMPPRFCRASRVLTKREPSWGAHVRDDIPPHQELVCSQHEVAEADMTHRPAFTAAAVAHDVRYHRLVIVMRFVARAGRSWRPTP